MDSMSKKSIKSSTDFGREIRMARKALNLTQPQLAGASGVGVRFIVDLEHGKPTCAINPSRQSLKNVIVRELRLVSQTRRLRHALPDYQHQLCHHDW
jgi:HTH-type transcriptional regulator/antitoxin HipB